MDLRGTIIAALLVIELAIIGEAGVAIRSGQPISTFTVDADARTATGPNLAEGGPHQIFYVGAHPALTVDIGYADLTIVAGNASQLDVSASASTHYGILRATAPITAREDGETIRIATTGGGRWTMGDDRMVTVIVPPRTQITVVNAGDIRANGLRGEASIKSIGHGSVTLDDYAAPTLRVTSKGRISLHEIVAAHLEANSSDGHVDGTALQVRDGSIESDGHVTLGFATGTDTLIHAQTSDGKISLSGFTAAASPATQRKSDDDDDSSSQTVRVGAGSGRLDVHSADGDIALTQGS